MPPHWPPHGPVSPWAPQRRLHRPDASHPTPRQRGPDLPMQRTSRAPTRRSARSARPHLRADPPPRAPPYRTYILLICLSGPTLVSVNFEDRAPVGGVDYPRPYQEFRSWFPTTPRVPLTWRVYAGQRVFGVRFVLVIGLGRHRRSIGNAWRVVARPR